MAASNFKPKDNSGVLFKNDRRETDNQPHARGRGMIGGVEYWISAWTKPDKYGNKFQSLSFKPMDSQEGPPDSGDQRRPAPKKKPNGDVPSGDDIPF